MPDQSSSGSRARESYLKPDVDALLPADLHPATKRLVIDFAVALAEKLAGAEQKYGYVDGWTGAHWEDECRERLYEHLQKGDPRDVANYCAFMWHHGWSTKAPVSESAGPKPYDIAADAVQEVADAAAEAFRKAGLEPNEWDGDDIVKDVSRGIAHDIERLASRSMEAQQISDADRRWRFLEHGCQWVSWIPINGDQVSFDPRNVTGHAGDLTDMRAQADIATEQHLAVLRAGIERQSGRD